MTSKSKDLTSAVSAEKRGRKEASRHKAKVRSLNKQTTQQSRKLDAYVKPKLTYKSAKKNTKLDAFFKEGEDELL